MDPVARFLRTRTIQRFIAVAAFVALLVTFRSLAPLLVFFLAFARALGVATDAISSRLRIPHKAALLSLVVLLLGLIGGGIGLGVGRGIHTVIELRRTLPDRIALIQQAPLYQQLQTHLQDTDKYLETAKHYATSAVTYVTEFGHLLLHAVIGLILAVIFLLERDELDEWYRTIDQGSLVGTILRWCNHVADAVALTIQLQLIVAALNAVFTLPILIALGLPHPGALALLIFASSLVPVVGNLVSGAILTVLAYHTRGFLGVGVFVVLTFILHKVESYYLNPRLTARHVHLPGLVLIASLIAWEHLLGIAGLFMSFPFLFVATRIRAEWRDEDQADSEPTGDESRPLLGAQRRKASGGGAITPR
jgi:predicted PurR-regulated permease PerM